MDDLPVTNRGFRIFVDRERKPEEVLYGKPVSITVVESSIATRGPHVRIYEGDVGIQLNMVEARMVRAALGRFLVEARDGRLTEKPL